MSTQANTPITVNDACRILRPLFDLADFRDLNCDTGRRLAALIHPRDADDLTVREISALLEQVYAEQSMRGAA